MPAAIRNFTSDWGQALRPRESKDVKQKLRSPGTTETVAAVTDRRSVGVAVGAAEAIEAAAPRTPAQHTSAL